MQNKAPIQLNTPASKEELLTGKQMAIIMILAIFLLSLDRFFKVAARIYLSHKDIDILHWIKLSFFSNTGIAFSCINEHYWIILPIWITIYLILFCSFYSFTHKKRATSILLFILASGAISNTIDRHLYGGVIDYINIKNFSVFNLSDVIITTSVISLLLLLFFKQKENSLDNVSQNNPKKSKQIPDVNQVDLNDEKKIV